MFFKYILSAINKYEPKLFNNFCYLLTKINNFIEAAISYLSNMSYFTHFFSMAKDLAVDMLKNFDPE